MKRMKKLLAVLLTAIMVMSMGTSVFAATGSESITITDVATANHTFSAYQIFDGDVSSGTMSNVVWGDGISDTSGFITDLLADSTIGTIFSGASITSTSTAAEVAKVVADNNSTSGFLAAFAAVAKNYVTTTSGTVSYVEDQTDGTYDYTISGLDAGYYLVTDSTTSGSTDTDAVSNYIVQVIPGTTTSIASKNEIPTVTKTIGSSTKGTSLSAGDTVSFTLTGTVPSEAANYTTYAYTFKDTLSSNLEYTTNTVAVTVGGTTVDSSEYSVDYDSTTNVLTISFTDVKAYAGKSIVVTYDATLSASTTTSKAETNTVVVEYSNNPNGSATGDTGTTVESKVYVYSFDLTVNKVDGNNTGLADAVFTLYKSVSLSSADDMVSGKTYVDSSFKTTTDYAQVAYVVVGTSEATSASNSYAVTFGNLEEGDYVLVESTTPEGYNTAANTSFTIKANYDTDGQITDLEDSGTVTASGTTGYTVTIENLSGSSLPVTGGMGTTILYIIGGILVAGAAVLLVTRRRMATR